MRKGTEKVNALFHETLRRRGTLIAAHRGTGGGNIIQNTKEAFRNAYRQHADIVELDVAASLEKDLFIFHDGNEWTLFGEEWLKNGAKRISDMTSEEIRSYEYYNVIGSKSGFRVNTFDEALDDLKGRGLINVDRSWWNLHDHSIMWEQVLPVIEKHGMLEQCLVKSDPDEEMLDFLERWEAPVVYMSKAFKAQDIEDVLRRDINTVAFECIFTDLDSDLLDPANQKEWRKRGVVLWTNALRLRQDWNRSAWRNDNDALLGDEDENWGWLADHGFSIIQTDWPAMMHEYLVRTGRRK